MSDSRTKNAARNVISGFFNKSVVLLLPFITRTIVLYLMGKVYLGVGTLFSSILNFLSLAELGFGSAIVYSMYKPIAEGDNEAICALLKYYRKIYIVVGSVVLLVGLVLLPFLPVLTKGELPEEGLNIYLLFIIYLINSVLSYFLAGYRQSLLISHQRSDIINKILMLVNIIVQFGQIFVLFITHNYYVYAFVPICGTIITNISVSVVTRKFYPEIACRGEISVEVKKDINKRITGLMGTKLNSIVVHSADTMVISAFLGVTVAGMYGNYHYILNAVSGFIMMFYSALTAGIGNKIATDSRESNYKLFNVLSLINAWVVGWCTVCMICLYQPFIKVWAGEEMMFGNGFVLLFGAYFFIYQIQRTILTFKDAAGLWYEDRFRPYVSMIFNVVSNLIMVKLIGINGIVLSTILAFFISMPWCNYVLFKNLFKMPAMKNLLQICVRALLTCGIVAVTYFLCSFCTEGILGIVERAVICIIVPNILFVLYFKSQAEFSDIISVVKRVLKKKVGNRS